MIGAPGEVVLPRRVQPQPTPEVVQGGDCGACVLGGALGRPIEEVYDRLKGERKAIMRGEMARMLRVAEMYALADRMIEAPAEWRSNSRHWPAFGFPAYMEALAWFAYVRMAVDAGYYGIANVDMNRKRGPDTDHWVMICGARVPARPADHEGGWTIRGDVLVSCSARASGMRDEWVDAREFLEHRGGYDILFVRPTGV